MELTNDDGQWIGPLVRKEIDRVYENAVNAFNRACDEIDRQEDEAKVRRIINDIWGLDMIPEPSSLSEGRR